MKIRVNAETTYTPEDTKRKEKQKHKEFRQLRKQRNSRWQSLD